MNSRVSFLIGCLLLAGLRIWFVHGDEVIARDAMRDNTWYATAAAHGYWSDRYAAPILRGCAYPLWIWGVNHLGIPLQVATEALLLAGAFALASAIRSAGAPSLIAVASFGVMIFHSVVLHSGTQVLADTLYTPMLWIALACLIGMWTTSDGASRVWLAIACGIALAILWHTREERILVTVYFGAYALVTVAIMRRPEFSWRDRFNRIGVVVMIPALIVGLADFTVRSANYTKFGLFTINDLTAPGYAAACRAILRVRPDAPKNNVLVTTDVRRKIYAISPSFARLLPYCEGPLAEHWGIGIRDWLHIDPGEIPASWFYWLMRDATYRIGIQRPAEADAFYRQIAREIDDAIDRGDLRSRFVASGFLEPDFTRWLPHLGDSMATQLAWFACADWGDLDAFPEVPPDLVALYDSVANRRAALVHRQFTLSGWAAARERDDPVRRILLRDARGAVLAETSRLTPRPDLVNFLSDVSLPLDRGYGFELQTNLPQTSIDEGNLVFQTATGREAAIAVELVRRSEVRKRWATSETDPNEATRVFYAIDTIALDDPRVGRNPWLPILWALNAMAAKWMTIVAPIAILVTLYTVRRRRRRNQLRAQNSVSNEKRPAIQSALLPAVLMIAIIIATRLMIFAIVDKAGWPFPSDARYLMPILPLYTVMLLLILTRCAQVVRRGEYT